MAKTFKDKIQQKSAVNPALQFISTAEEPAPVESRPAPRRRDQGEAKQKAASTPPKPTPARRALPQYDEETKSRRLQLLLTPSLYEAVRERATREHISVNELINAILKDATRK